MAHGYIKLPLIDGGVGGSGANVTLNNLTSPTAINQDLLPNSDQSAQIGNDTLAWSNIYVADLLAPGATNPIFDLGQYVGYYSDSRPAFSFSDGTSPGDAAFYDDTASNNASLDFSFRTLFDANGSEIADWSNSGGSGFVVNATQGLTTTAGISVGTNIAAAGFLSLSTGETVLSGSVGSMICVQPAQGSSYKKAIIDLQGFTDTGSQIYTFPTPFLHVPYIYGLTAGVAGATITASTIKFTVTTLTGFVFAEGF